ncbi:TonB family protein [Echinicola sediminis]
MLALCFPLIEIPVGFSKPSISLENTAFLQALAAQQHQDDIVGTFGLPEVTVTSTKLPILLEWKDYLFIAYLLVALLLTGRLLWQFLQLRFLKEKGWYQTVYRLKGNYFLIPTFGLAPVFSFFDKLFWDDTQNLTPNEREQIIKHEVEHIKQGHSWDMLYYQALSILFWFNPGIHLMRSALIDTHEFSADDNVISQTLNRENYSQLIVKIAFKGMDLPIGNHFIRSSTLKRIMMMKKTKKINWFKLLLVPPLSVMLLGLVSLKTINPAQFLGERNSINLSQIETQIKQAQDSINVNTKVYRIESPKHAEYVSALKNGTLRAQIGNLQYEIGNISNLSEYRQVLEMIEIFKGHSDFDKKYQTPDLVSSPEVMPLPVGGKGAWFAALNQNLSLSEDAKKLGTNGTVYIQLVVTSKGEFKEPTILRSLGAGLDDIALKALSAENLPKWNPAKVDNLPVNSLVIIPVRFQNDAVTQIEPELFTANKTSKQAISPFINPEGVYDIVEQMPKPKGGISEFNRYLSKNLIYPQAAREKQIQGTVFASFVVDEKGHITQASILRGIGGNVDEEALRVLNEAPAWNPGMQDGEPVAVKMLIPFRFKIAGTDSPGKINFPEAPNMLGETVIVAYGSQAKKKRPLSETNPNIKVAPIASDKPDPMFIINGEEHDLGQISPKDIENIQVLKRKSATEKYGVKGKNGVVEITLKEGVALPKKSGKQPASDALKSTLELPALAKGKEPLYIVDGVITKGSHLKNAYGPENIKSITVLKEGNATDLYGSAAQNGAILISTIK